MPYKRFISSSLLLLSLSSCALYHPQHDAQQAIDKQLVPANWAQNQAIPASADSDWLQQFNDPLMLALIKEGQANNTDLRLAAANMDKAWLLAKQAGARLKPTVDLSLARTQSGSADGGSSTQAINVGVTASWELDLWGRIQAGVDAASSSAQASTADYLFAKHSLSNNIAKTYLKIIEAKQQAQLAQNNLEISQKNLRITLLKLELGSASEQDAALNKANVALAKDQLLNLNASTREALRAIEVLLGRYPSSSIDIANVLPTLPKNPPAGIPSSVLERRPDIIAAERRVASAFNASAQAKAAQLPSFSLTGTLSGASPSLSDILSPANVAWQLGANLLTPLFDAGKRRIDVDIRNLEQQQALDDYAGTALNAFAEVEHNLDLAQVLSQREAVLAEALKQSQKSYHIAQLRYQEGESSLLDTLSFQQQAISTKSSLLFIKRAQLEQRLNLYLALGGNW